MKLTNKEWLEIYELNKKFNKEKRLYKLDDYINNLSGQKERWKNEKKIYNTHNNKANDWGI